MIQALERRKRNMVFFSHISIVLFMALNINWFVGCRQITKYKPHVDLYVIHRDLQKILEAITGSEDITSAQEIWITLDSDMATKLTDSKIVPRSEKAMSEVNTTLLPVHASMLNKIRHFVHDKKQSRGAVFSHRSFEEGKQHLERVKYGDRSVFIAPVIDNYKVARSLLNVIDQWQMGIFNSRIVTKFKNRHAKSQYGAKAANWLKSEWEQLVSGRSDIEVLTSETPGYRQSSVIVKIYGSEDLIKDVVVIGAHLDSINKKDLTDATLQARGADDNASGLAVLTEIIRAIVEVGYKPQKTVLIIGFAAEEVGLKGSADIASHMKNERVNVLGMVNFDMVGYKGTGKDIYISTDDSNKDLAMFLRKLLDYYLPTVSHDFMQCGYSPCSDHASFYYKDFPAAMGTTSHGRIDDPATFNPNYHTENDLYCDTYSMSNHAKLAAIYMAELAKGTIDVI